MASLTRHLRSLLDTSPDQEPTGGLLWSVEDAPGGTRWQCLRCESGTGSDPDRARANQAAHTHFLANHTATETTHG